MAILLSHTSALEFWRSPEGRLWRRNPQGGRPFSVRPNAKTRRAPLALESEGSHALYSPSRRDVRDVLGRPYLGLSRPIHVLVPQRNRRYHSKLVISHVQTTPLPARYIVEVAPGIFAVTPEVCFVPSCQRQSFSQSDSSYAGHTELIRSIKSGSPRQRRFARPQKSRRSSNLSPLGELAERNDWRNTS